MRERAVTARERAQPPARGCPDPQAPWVAAAYRFRPVADPERVRTEMERECRAGGLRGTVLIAAEGINANLAGEREALQAFVGRHFPSDRGAPDVNWSRAAPGNLVFDRLKVRVKPEIVTFGSPLEPHAAVGRHVSPDEWNRLLEDPETLVVDVRNAFESRMGTFRGASPADTASFRDFGSFADALEPGRPVAMFCTGGIRCEKASALLRARGFDEVHQLDGGILRYLAETPPEASAFVGECFVFDQRGSVVTEPATGEVTEAPRRKPRLAP